MHVGTFGLVTVSMTAFMIGVYYLLSRLLGIKEDADMERRSVWFAVPVASSRVIFPQLNP